MSESSEVCSEDTYVFDFICAVEGGFSGGAVSGRHVSNDLIQMNIQCVYVVRMGMSVSNEM
jgi:hypothetical protein